jgi:hypothetical protein
LELQSLSNQDVLILYTTTVAMLSAALPEELPEAIELSPKQIGVFNEDCPCARF